MTASAIFTIVCGIVSSIIATYIIRYIDNKYKNNRHNQ